MKNTTNNKTLYLVKMGMDFSHDLELQKLSDVNSHSVRTQGCVIEGKDGNTYFLEFATYTKMQTRTTSKRGNKLLKKPVREVVLKNALHVNTQFDNTQGSFRNINLEKEIHDKNYTYTIENILNVANYISKDNYTEVKFVER